MKVNRYTALFVIILGMLAGCANKGVNSDSASEASNDSREIPSWFLEPPVEEDALYSTGVARSSDMQMGMDRAMLAAKRDLAGQINNRLSSKMKEFVSEVGQGGNNALNREVSTITKNVVTEVNLAVTGERSQKWFLKEEIIEFSSFCDIQLMRQIGFLNGLMEIIKLNQWSKHQRLSRILRKKLKMLEKESSDFFKCMNYLEYYFAFVFSSFNHPLHLR